MLGDLSSVPKVLADRAADLFPSCQCAGVNACQGSGVHDEVGNVGVCGDREDAQGKWNLAVVRGIPTVHRLAELKSGALAKFMIGRYAGVQSQAGGILGWAERHVRDGPVQRASQKGSETCKIGEGDCQVQAELVSRPFSPEEKTAGCELTACA